MDISQSMGILSAISQEVIRGRIVASTAAVLVYDYFCTLDQEIKHIWLGPSYKRLGVVLFLLNRYLPFVDTVIALNAFTVGLSSEACQTGAHLVAVLTVFGTLITQLVLYARTCALWTSVHLIRYVTITMILGLLAGLVATVLDIQSSQSDRGCTLRASRLISIGYALLVLSETGVLVLTLIKVLPLYRTYRTPLIVHLYRDGLIFYICMFSFSIANILVLSLASDGFRMALVTPQRVMHSLLTTRVLLMRVTYGRGEDTLEDSSTRFPGNWQGPWPAHSWDISLGERSTPRADSGIHIIPMATLSDT